MSDEATQAADLRAQHVTGLQTELAFLERQPQPNKVRVAEVKAELDRYADKPARRKRETRNG